MDQSFTLRYALAADDSDPDAIIERLGAAGSTAALVGVGLRGQLALQFIYDNATRRLPSVLAAALLEVEGVIPTARLLGVEVGDGPVCHWCEEPIRGAELATASCNAADQWNHYECGLRSIAGSVGHQRKRCSCYGGTEEDPPGAGRREAARAAAAYFLAEQAARANPDKFLAAIAQTAKGRR